MSFKNSKVAAQNGFPHPIRYYDIHVYFNQKDPADVESITLLREKIRNTFPTINVFGIVPYPIGPHPVGMFELHLRSPTDFAQFVPWFLINRGTHNALLHPNTQDPLKDHTINAMWFGDKLPLYLDIFNPFMFK
ncbi:hypothetical protein DSO57_1008547 [Entomophthora muscae]|uniref:Uncharacterized protein n=1 Tax=Entomophthora muscae TaxID=34485 RepID=A0ACC2UTD4_9FUNG|nr:hypothetical protein DSO57_1008547 [Entomophthora muscae]